MSETGKLIKKLFLTILEAEKVKIEGLPPVRAFLLVRILQSSEAVEGITQFHRTRVPVTAYFVIKPSPTTH
jgi:hypothetical protein